MSKYGRAGARWAQARNAHCSPWAQAFNRNFGAAARGGCFLSEFAKCMEYNPIGQKTGQGFAEQCSAMLGATGTSVGTAAASSDIADIIDQTVAEFLSGMEELQGLPVCLINMCNLTYVRHFSSWHFSSR